MGLPTNPAVPARFALADSLAQFTSGAAGGLFADGLTHPVVRPSPSYHPPNIPSLLALSIPSLSAFVILDPVRFSPTWAFTVCLSVCSSSPFLDPWRASA